MSSPYNDDTRESYIERMKEYYLYWAEQLYVLGHKATMWIYLFNWVQCEEIYGKHWDDLKAKGKV